MAVTFDDAQQQAIDRIVERRLTSQRRVHERELRAQREQLESEIARLQLELRTERGIIARVRAWLSKGEQEP